MAKKFKMKTVDGNAQRWLGTVLGSLAGTQGSKFIKKQDFIAKLKADAKPDAKNWKPLMVDGAVGVLPGLGSLFVKNGFGSGVLMGMSAAGFSNATQTGLEMGGIGAASKEDVARFMNLYGDLLEGSGVKGTSKELKLN